MKKELNQYLETYCELHWWNFRKKTLDFKGSISELLKSKKISYKCIKTEREGVFKITFKNDYGIIFSQKKTLSEFPFLAKQFIQMELVRMGDKSQLYVQNTFRPTVTINF